MSHVVIKWIVDLFYYAAVNISKILFKYTERINLRRMFIKADAMEQNIKD